MKHVLFDVSIWKMTAINEMHLVLITDQGNMIK